MEQEERQKMVGMFKKAIDYEELNLVKIQKDCRRDWQEIVFKNPDDRKRGEEILTKLIVESLGHASIFANLIIKIYKEGLSDEK